MQDVDRSAYPSYRWHLPSSFKDVGLMEEVSKRYGAASIKCLHNPTVEQVEESLRRFSANGPSAAKKGDLIFFTFAGHGIRIPDVTGVQKKKRKLLGPCGRRAMGKGSQYHSTILLWDRLMLDDEFIRIWQTYAPGVRVLTMFATCHSGSAEYLQQMSLEFSASSESADRIDAFAAGRNQVDTLAGEGLAAKIYERHMELYNRLQIDDPVVHVDGVHFSACKDDQTASQYDDGSGSPFCIALNKYLMSAQPPPSYKQLKRDVVADVHRQGMRYDPQGYGFGASRPDVLKERPFATGA
jgi:hypothetical protein